MLFTLLYCQSNTLSAILSYNSVPLKTPNKFARNAPNYHFFAIIVKRVRFFQEDDFNEFVIILV